MLKHFDSLFDLMDAFPDEQSCIDHLRSIRWRNGEFCPQCGCTRIMHFSDKKTFKCSDCRVRFSIKVGTIFQDTKLPLRKWFMAIWLITNHSKGIASTTLAKDLKITQKSAWFVLHRLRHAARTQSFAAPLDNEVEADTTYVGGKEKNKHANKKTPGSQGGANKAVVFGMIERNGELRTAHVVDGKAETLQDQVRANVTKGAAVLTDEDRAFVGLGRDFVHLAVNHSAGEYVRLGGFVHTNSIEGVWALLKRQIYGIHHWVSDKHLKRYVGEMTYRFNARGQTVTDRMNGMFARVEGPIPYKGSDGVTDKPKKMTEPPLRLDISFEEALTRFAKTDPKEISEKSFKTKKIGAKLPSKEITPSTQGELFSTVEKDVGGIGMGVLSDGTPYLNQRGLAALCGVQNAHIGTISSQWNEREQKPRITSIKTVLNKAGFANPTAHIEIIRNGVVNYCYPAEVCLAVLEYYAFDAGPNCQPEARDNFRLLAGSKLRELIYSQVGYDPTGGDRFKAWHDRIALNYQSAPRGYFHVFNEAHTIIYELIHAGAAIGEKFVVDISVGQHWSRYWDENGFAGQFGARNKYPHRYPDTHPQSLSNPQESWCYPLAALGAFREWLQGTYIEGGKFSTYLKGKVSRGELPPSVAQLAISTLVPAQIEGPQ